MKKKSPRGIPDFSRKHPQGHPLAKPEITKTKPFNPRAPMVKPPATNSKSGRRGS